MISKDKKYKTRSGLEVEILRTGLVGSYSVVGVVRNSAGCTFATWTEKGESTLSYESDLDLIEVEPKVSLDKKYETGDGRRVTLFSLGGVPPYSILGAIHTEEGLELAAWNENCVDGECDCGGDGECGCLAEVDARDFWIVVFEDGIVELYKEESEIPDRPVWSKKLVRLKRD